MTPPQRCLAVLLLSAGICACSGAGPVDRVIVVTWDTTRADRLGCYGYEAADTPNLDGLAAEATLFEHAVSPVPTTLSSHSTMFTGLYPHDHGVRYNIVYSLGPRAVTLAERLQARGFDTAAFPASLIVGRNFGLDQGFETWNEPQRAADAKGPTTPESVERTAGEGVDLAIEWLDSHSHGRSFLWLHFYDPHAPYDPPFPYSDRYRGRRYDGELAYVDAQFGRLLERLREDRLWSRTVVIVAGDHGEGLYDHRERYHSYLVYDTTQHVPLIIRAPGVSPGRIREPVTLADLTPTVLDLVGTPANDEMRGISLRPALEGETVPRRPLYFESLAGSLNYGWQELRGIRSGEWKLIDSEEPELFDLERDGAETTNRVAVDTDRLDALQAQLAALSEPLETSLADAVADVVLDRETEQMLASLGYVSGGSGGASENAQHPRTMIDLEGEMMSTRRDIALGQWPAVEERCRYVLGRDPSNKWGLNTIISALIAQDRAGEAQDHAAELVRLYPDAEQSYVVFARAYEAEGLIEEAYRVLETAVSRIPDSGPLNYLLIVAAFETGRTEVCGDRIDAAIEAFPEAFQMRVMQARCREAEGDDDGALASLSAAVDRGLSLLGMLAEEGEFATLADRPEFQELLERSGGHSPGAEDEAAAPGAGDDG